MILEAKIENYKSIKNQFIKLKKFNVIVGKNASGKTNFLSAIQLFKHLSSGGGLEDFLGTISPLTAFYLPTHKSEASFEFLITTREGNTFRFSYKFNFSKVAGRFRFTIPKETLKRVRSGGDEEIIYRRDRDSSFVGHQQDEIPLKVEPNKLMLSIYANEQAKEVVNTVSGYNFLESALGYKEGWTIIDGNRPPLDTIDGVAVSLYTKENMKEYEDAIRSIKKILPDFDTPRILRLDETSIVKDDASNGDKIKRYVVTWREKNLRSDGELDFGHNSLSHGDRRVIHLLLSLFNTEKNSFLAVEEIENGMHYARLERLLDEFRTQAANRKIQVVFTTHSYEILKGVNPNEVISCRKESESCTQLDRLLDAKEYPTVADELQNPSAAEIMDSGLF